MNLSLKDFLGSSFYSFELLKNKKKMEVTSMDSRTKLSRSESSHITLEIFLFCLQFLNCKMEMLSYFINSNVHTFPYFNFFPCSRPPPCAAGVREEQRREDEYLELIEAIPFLLNSHN